MKHPFLLFTIIFGVFITGIATTRAGLHPTVIAYCSVTVLLHLLALTLSHTKLRTNRVLTN